MHRSPPIHRHQAILTWFAVALLVLLQVELLPRFSVDDVTETTANSDKSAVSAQYANLPLAFEPNQGQIDGSASYLVHHGQATTYFDGVNTTTTIGDDHITMSLEGAATPNFTGTNQLESKTNYFIGNDQSKWHSDVPNYKEILANNVYPGIDLKYYGTNSQLEHDFIVNPGADPGKISFHFDGQQDLSIDNNGNLILKTTSDELHLNAPTTYQQDAHSKHTIPSEFKLRGNTVTVALNADYDHSQPLVIDPTLSLIYSTYLGGSATDSMSDITIDASGNAYIAGQTTSTNYPTASPVQAANAGGATESVVTKFNPSGSALVYSTYLGGTAADASFRIAVDVSGNAYVVGYTYSSNFPTVTPYQAVYGGNGNATITKLNPSGSALVFSTYLGGSVGFNSASGVAVDATGSVYVTGFTGQTNFPTASPLQASNAGGFDAYITKFSPSGTTLVYSTYLGGTGNDAGDTIAVDTSGNAYVTGNTASTNFPTASPFQAANAGGRDVFVTKINAAGSALTYSTYLGGSANEEVIGMDYRSIGIAIDSAGNAYIVGNTTSTNYPTASPIQAANAGGQDVFISKLNASGSSLVYSTYLGGTGDDQGNSIALDTDGSVFAAGWTNSTNYPISSAFQAANAGGHDVFVSKLNPAGSALTYSTYLGGSSGDDANEVAVGLNGNAYLVGGTLSTNFPTASSFQAANAGGYDVFVTQFTEHNVNLTAQVNPTLSFTVGSTSCSLGTLSVSQTQQCTYALTAATNGTSGYMISYLPVATLTSGANTITALSSLTASTLATEQFGINLRANTTVGSHTASNFGADVSGGSGTVASAYNTANSFKLVAAGDTIAAAGSPSLSSTYTVSTIANIASITEAGSYTTTLTYNIVAGY